jgi:hypothetical protein
MEAKVGRKSVGLKFRGDELLSLRGWGRKAVTVLSCIPGFVLDRARPGGRKEKP